ncbi:hypothetical protein [Pseudalkalibacillus caeni]|nr:hypothetical protein [Pseudalkalibacillus caeni]
MEERTVLMEIFYVFVKSHGTTLEDVEEILRMKAEKRGAFDEKYS